jgi:hypothetical protein
MLENSSLFLLLEKKKAFWPGENYYSIYKYTFEVGKLSHNLLMNKSKSSPETERRIQKILFLSLQEESNGNQMEIIYEQQFICSTI